MAYVLKERAVAKSFFGAYASQLLATLRALCSDLAMGSPRVVRRLGNAARLDTLEQSLGTPDIDAAVALDDLSSMRFSDAVLKRLEQIDENEGAAHLCQTLFTTVAAVAAEWPKPRSVPGSDARNASEETRERAARLERFLATLDRSRAHIFLMHVNSKLTYREIAQRLGMDPERVLKQLAQTFSALRQYDAQPETATPRIAARTSERVGS